MRVLSLSGTPFWDVEDRKGMPSIYLGQKAFVDAGHEVLFAFPGEANRSYDYHGIRVHEFRLRFPIASPRHLWLHRLSLKLYWVVLLIVATVKGHHLCRTFRPDVIYGHAYYGAPVAWALARMWGVPNVTRLYGTFLAPWVGSFFGRMRKIEELVAFKVPCRYLIVTNDGTRGDVCAAALGVPTGRLRFWRNGVDKAMYDPSVDRDAFKDALGIPHEHKVLLAVSRLVNWKRVDRLIGAMPRVLAGYPAATAVIVGDGEDRDALERLARELGVNDHVRFVGLVSHAEVPRFMNAADVFVSLYDVSNMGNPLLEAVSCGRCIVSINNGATGEINREGEVAVLLDEGRLETLPDVLVGLLRDDARQRALGRAAREYALKHLRAWPERLEMEVRLIEDLVRSGRSAASAQSWSNRS